MQKKMTLKDMLFKLDQLGGLPCWDDSSKKALKSAGEVLCGLSRHFDMVGKDYDCLLNEAEALIIKAKGIDAMAEQLQSLLSFAVASAAMIDAAAENDIHGAEAVQALYRKLDLSNAPGSHLQAGMKVFLVSGRIAGRPDGCAELITADSSEAAEQLYVGNILGEVFGANAEGEDPTYFIDTNELVGILDIAGRIVRQ